MKRRSNRRHLPLVTVMLLAACLMSASYAFPVIRSHVTQLIGQPSSDAPATGPLDPAHLPGYSGSPYEVVNANIPFFSSEDLSRGAFQELSELDPLDRCGSASALVSQQTMPTERRGEIGMVRPSGWHIAKYDFIEGRYLFNRCHLIGYQLTGINADERNLITGTRYLNVEGMQPFEDEVVAYVLSTGNSVLYRVTPVFSGNDLVASGVLMEARSIEDDGTGLQFCVWVHNVQPGVVIDYATGESWADGTVAAPPPVDTEEHAYILNTNSMRFHRPDCPAVTDMQERNKQGFDGTREEAIALGYQPCGKCKP